MAFSIYDAAIPPIIHMLGSLHSVLAKGEAHARDAGDHAPYIEARLAQDMLPFTAQVQIACDTAKGAGARLTGTEAPKFEDTETNFLDLKARVEKTIAYLRGLDPALFAGAEDRPITLKFPQREFHFSGKDYLNLFVLPNFYFHLTTAYGLLRARGVALGKADYLGGQKPGP